MGFHPVAVVVRLVQKYERDSNIQEKQYTKNTKAHNTQNGKQTLKTYEKKNVTRVIKKRRN
jgi:hypothetical protein